MEFSKEQVQRMGAFLAREQKISEAGALQRLQEMANASAKVEGGIDKFFELGNDLLARAAEWEAIFDEILYGGDPPHIDKGRRAFAAGALSMMSLAEIKVIAADPTLLGKPG